MNRRDLLKGVAGLTAGLVLPASVAENAEVAKRYWSLGAMPNGRTSAFIPSGTFWLSWNEKTLGPVAYNAVGIDVVSLDAAWTTLGETRLVYAYDTDTRSLTISACGERVLHCAE